MFYYILEWYIFYLKEKSVFHVPLLPFLIPRSKNRSLNHNAISLLLSYACSYCCVGKVVPAWISWPNVLAIFFNFKSPTQSHLLLLLHEYMSAATGKQYIGQHAAMTFLKQ